MVAFFVVIGLAYIAVILLALHFRKFNERDDPRSGWVMEPWQWRSRRVYGEL